VQLELELELDVQLEVSGFPFFNTSQWEKKEKKSIKYVQALSAYRCQVKREIIN